MYLRSVNQCGYIRAIDRDREQVSVSLAAQQTSQLERVSARVVVVVVVVRELFSLVLSVICVRIEVTGQSLRRLFTTWLNFSSTAAFLPQWLRRDNFPLYFAM